VNPCGRDRRSRHPERPSVQFQTGDDRRSTCFAHGRAGRRSHLGPALRRQRSHQWRGFGWAVPETEAPLRAAGVTGPWGDRAASEHHDPGACDRLGRQLLANRRGRPPAARGRGATRGRPKSGSCQVTRQMRGRVALAGLSVVPGLRAAGAVVDVVSVAAWAHIGPPSTWRPFHLFSVAAGATLFGGGLGRELWKRPRIRDAALRDPRGSPFPSQADGWLCPKPRRLCEPRTIVDLGWPSKRSGGTPPNGAVVTGLAVVPNGVGLISAIYGLIPGPFLGGSLADGFPRARREAVDGGR